MEEGSNSFALASGFLSGSSIFLFLERILGGSLKSSFCLATGFVDDDDDAEALETRGLDCVCLDASDSALKTWGVRPWLFFSLHPLLEETYPLKTEKDLQKKNQEKPSQFLVWKTNGERDVLETC